jgi:hypothetical protein
VEAPHLLIVVMVLGMVVELPQVLWTYLLLPLVGRMV